MATALSEDDNACIGGYDISLVLPLPEALTCFFCKLLMRDAIQTYRGDRACESCYRQAKGSSELCPIDQEPIEDEEIFADRFARYEIGKLMCNCSVGCEWVGKVMDLEMHQEQCPHGSIVCNDCSKSVLRKDEEEHLKNGCYGTKERRIMFSEEPVACAYVCGESMKLSDIYSHVTVCEKLKTGTICPYEVVGCKYKPISSIDLNEHLLRDTNIHAAITVANITNLKADSRKIDEDLRSEQLIRKEMMYKIDKNSLKTMADELRKLQERVTKVQEEHEVLKEQYGHSIKHLSGITEKDNWTEEEQSYKHVDGMLKDITKKYNDVESRMMSRQPGSITVATNPSELNKVVVDVDRLEGGSAILSSNFSDLELKLQLLENTTYDGKQLWKVDNIYYRINQAVIGKVTALHSAPCFQQRGGYKFCCRLYLNGDGMGRGTHVSLFFVLMKSEYDSLLKWPFSERVTFRLINPYDANESIVESFIPDKDSSSFKRPQKDMNIAAGCPMFIRKENIHNYIINDVIYIETSISSE